jgi:hypothetical protein
VTLNQQEVVMKNKALMSIVAAVVAAVLLAFGIDPGQLDSKPARQPTSQQPSTPPADDARKGTTAPATASASDKKWSSTTPGVNLAHIFRGGINRKGKPVGYHSRPKGHDSPGARLIRIRSGPNQTGVYTATIAIRDGSQWKEKFSSFYPDAMSRQEVINAILSAYQHSRDKNKQPWRGPSGKGFDIQGYTLSRGDINTAFPVFER